jgi:SAM-dependent methyltransferase
MEDFRDPATAQSWDADPIRRNPTRPEQLDIMLSILEEMYEPGEAILDVGIGTGIIEEMIFERVPGAYVVGVDGSPAMLEIAHRRLEIYAGRYEVVVHELREIGGLELPKRQYQTAISVQTIHNVADEYKPPIFRFIYDALESGGMFLLLDRIAIDTPGLFETYKSLWKRLNRVHSTTAGEGETFAEHVEQVRVRGDLPANLEQHLRWLREAGFEAACLHLHGNRALFAARKV